MTHLSTNAVIVEFRVGQGRVPLPRPAFVGIDEALGERGTKEDVVRAAGPTVVLAARVFVHGSIAAAVHMLARATGLRDRVRYARRSDRKEIGRLPSSCG